MRKTLEDIKNKLEFLNQTVASAESCTGGRIASALTLLPGSSSIFQGGVVTYSNESKEKILSVESQILQEYGAVSQETVERMAEGLIELFNVDWALVSSGVAGPGGGSQRTPCGLVWMAIKQRGKKPYSWKEIFPGNREEVMEATVLTVLNTFLSQI